MLNFVLECCNNRACLVFIFFLLLLPQLFLSKIHIASRLLLYMMLFSFVGYLSSCQSTSSCGNEVHKVTPKKVSGGGTKSCGNETHKVKKKRKMKKNKMGLFGKGENPYRRR